MGLPTSAYGERAVAGDQPSACIYVHVLNRVLTN